MGKRLNTWLLCAGTARHLGRRILLRIENHLLNLRRREEQAEHHLEVGGAVALGRLLTHSPRQRLAADHLEASGCDLEAELSREQPAARLSRRLARKDAPAGEPPVGLRLYVALAQQYRPAVGREKQHIRAPLDQAVQRLAVLLVGQPQPVRGETTSVVVRYDALVHRTLSGLSSAVSDASAAGANQTGFGCALGCDSGGKNSV